MLTRPFASRAVATLAALAAVSAFDFTHRAHAELVYSGLVNISVTNGDNGVSINLDQSGPTEFDFFETDGPEEGVPFLGAQQSESGFKLVGSGTMGYGFLDGVASLSLGTTVGVGSAFADGPGYGFDTNAGGQFANGSDGYFGFTFNPTGSQALYGYGHLQRSVDGNSATLVDWYYQNSGASIEVGDMVPVPEPTGALVGWLCAVGAWSARRRRA